MTALLDRRYHRYRAERGMLQVQRGVFSRTNWLVPVTRIQAVTLRRTWIGASGAAVCEVCDKGATPTRLPQPLRDPLSLDFSLADCGEASMAAAQAVRFFDPDVAATA
jgi:hypothetical protein